jgi:hypothetical protein
LKQGVALMPFWQVVCCIRSLYLTSVDARAGDRVKPVLPVTVVAKVPNKARTSTNFGPRVVVRVVRRVVVVVVVVVGVVRRVVRLASARAARTTRAQRTATEILMIALCGEDTDV